MERWKAKVEICGGSIKARGRRGEGGRGRGEWRGEEGVTEEEESRYPRGRAAFERCEGRRLEERERGQGETKGGIESVQRS